MRELEARYEKELVVIGVHSGKYHAERITSRIRDASIRLDSIHPIVNDRQFRIWRSYAVSAWPTLVAIDPGGYVVGAHAGEFTAEMLVPFIEGLIENARARKTLNEDPLRFACDEPTNAPGKLRYPGKVAIDGDRIAIADSGHNRVIVARLTEDATIARIEMIVGAEKAGFVDGSQPRFRSPQGLLFAGDVLYVADTENHAVRSVTLESGNVVTVAGTGRQLRTRADRDAGAMSSPWDIALAGSSLYVAMAGTHQIWSVDLESRRSRVHSGTGGEDIRDGENHNALLAQPMGIASHGDLLFFADSESNAIRQTGSDEGASVATIVGTGLFDFGDVDGSGDEVRLQHPQGITNKPNGGLLVADSYNDCVKLVEPLSRTSNVWARGLNEPSGIACSGTHAYVADTNTHRIVTLDLATRDATELTLE
ncbi:MAG: alkyl hydroperoxide reductase [Gemmatimonas sp.]